jgi:hypothetical protein
MIAPIVATVILFVILVVVIRTSRQRDEINLSREAENALRRLDREHRLLRERARLNP